MSNNSPSCRLLLGDCLEVLQQLPTASVDLVVCDLPYGVTDCEWDKALPFPDLWQGYRRVLRPFGTVALFCIQPFTTKLIQSNLPEFRFLWYWKKGNVTGGPFCKVQPMRCIEEIAVFGMKSDIEPEDKSGYVYSHSGKILSRYTYNPQGLQPTTRQRVRKSGKSQVYHDVKNICPQEWTGYPTHFLPFAQDCANGLTRLHPTQKPVALLEYLIRTHSNPGDTVLDNTMGSGSTGVACVHTGRNFIGIEKEPKYFEISSRRIAEAKEKLATIQ